MTALTDVRTIVVGVDGSKASTTALRWAAEQARALRAEVVAVHAWQPSGPGLAPYAPAARRPTDADERDEAARLLASAVRQVFGPRAGAVRAELVEGPAARVLLDRARGALLLALGRTVRGQGDAPTIGPVGRECLRRATVPVVAVPAAGRPAVPRRALAGRSRPRGAVPEPHSV